MKLYSIIAVALIVPAAAMAQKKFDKQSHRGGAGLYPENTIAAAKNALRLGTTIEMDLYMSKDSQIVVTHDPHIIAAYTLHANGTPVLPAEENELMIKNLNYSQIEQIETGLRPYDKYPRRKNVKAHIPRFADLIDSAEHYAKVNHLPPPQYNIQPGPAYTITDEFRRDFIKKMMTVILSRKIQSRAMIQAFDTGMLEVTRHNYPFMPISFLIGQDEASLTDILKRLTFTPDIFSPYYKMVTPEMVKTCHSKNIKVLPWTVNTRDEIEALKAMKVDGIITDYPDLFTVAKVN